MNDKHLAEARSLIARKGWAPLEDDGTWGFLDNDHIPAFLLPLLPDGLFIDHYYDERGEAEMALEAAVVALLEALA